MIFNRLGLILNRESRRGVAPSKTPLPPLLKKERGHRSKTLRGVRLFHKNQMGFTVVELMLAIAVAGVITGGITMTIFQVFDANTRTSNHMTAVRQVQNAGYWVSHDALMAQSIDLDPVDDPLTLGTEVLTLAWVGWEYECGDDTCISTHEVRYTYDSDKLWRYETITIVQYDSDGSLVDPQPAPQDSTALIAEHITDVTIDDNKLIVTITASVGETEEERTYEITPRPST